MSQITIEIPDELISRLPQQVEVRNQILTHLLIEYLQPKGVSGKSLLKFAGIISPSDLNIIDQAIQEDCSKVDHDEW